LIGETELTANKVENIFQGAKPKWESDLGEAVNSYKTFVFEAGNTPIGLAKKYGVELDEIIRQVTEAGYTVNNIPIGFEISVGSNGGGWIGSSIENQENEAMTAVDNLVKKVFGTYQGSAVEQ